MKRLLVVPAFLGLAVLAGLGLILAWPRVPLDSALTAPATPPARLVCYGYVDTRHGPLLLQPARAGRVIQVFVKEGQTVSKDTPLLQLDDRLVKLYEEEAELGVRAAQVELTKAQNGLKQYQAKEAQAKTAVQLAQKKMQAAQHFLTVKQDLLKDGFSNDGQLKLARDQVNEAEMLVALEQNKLAELNALDPGLEAKLAQLQLDRSKAQLRRAVQEREEMLLKAPAGGTVLRLYAQEGDLAGPTAPRPAVCLAPAGEWIIRSEVSQEFAGRVREGLVAQVEDEASGAVIGRGTIAQAADWFLPRRQLSLDPTSINTGLALECVLALDEGHAPLRLGQRVRVRVLADEAAGQLKR
jgi:HlyD family secretion protein